MTTINNLQDVLDSRNIIERLEELQETRDALLEQFEGMPENAGVDFGNWVRNQVGFSSEEYDELLALETLCEDGEGATSDGIHGAQLIRDSYFETHAQEVAEECGMIDKNATWPNTCIDWEKAASELQWDYTSVEFGNVTYWVR